MYSTCPVALRPVRWEKRDPNLQLPSGRPFQDDGVLLNAFALTLGRLEGGDLFDEAECCVRESSEVQSAVELWGGSRNLNLRVSIVSLSNGFIPFHRFLSPLLFPVLKYPGDSYYSDHTSIRYPRVLGHARRGASQI